MARPGDFTIRIDPDALPLVGGGAIHVWSIGAVDDEVDSVFPDKTTRRCTYVVPRTSSQPRLVDLPRDQVVAMLGWRVASREEG